MADYVAYYTSEDPDTNAILSDGTATGYNNVRIRKSGDSEDPLSAETGTNAAVLVQNRGNLEISNSYITSNAIYGNALFCKGSGSKFTLTENTIETNTNKAPGITSIEGSFESNNNNVTTFGSSSPAIENKGAKSTITGGSYFTAGGNSPVGVITGDLDLFYIDTLTSSASDGFIIKGNCTLNAQQCTLNMNGLAESTAFNLTLDRQDSELVPKLVSNGCTINVGNHNNVGLFATSLCNAQATVTKTKINGAVETSDLIKVTRNGSLEFTASEQVLLGTVTVDDNCSLSMVVNEKSSFTGKINTNGQAGNVSINISNGSWTLTGDSYVSTFIKDESSVLTLNGYILYVNGIPFENESETIKPVEPDAYVDVFVSTRDNENAYSIYEGVNILSTVKFEKTGIADTEDASVRGINAAVLSSGAGLTISENSYITTNGTHAPGVVSINNSEVTLQKMFIKTQGPNSEGVVSSYDGNLTTTNIYTTTEGENSPAIYVAEESGYVTINGGVYLTKGLGSPVMEIGKNTKQSIDINNSVFESNKDNGINITGSQKRMSINNTDITSVYGTSLNIDNSNSEESDEVEIAINNSSLNNGIKVNGVTTDLNFTRGKSFGNINVSNCHLTIDNNQGLISGNILVDSNSRFDLRLHDSADFVGAINSSNIVAQKISVSLKNGQWTLTGDSYIDALSVDKYSNIYIGEHTLYVSGTPSEIIVGSVVNYTNSAGTISETDVVVITKTTRDDTVYLTLYDTDDRVTYNNVLLSEVTFTGKVINVEPILQQLDELARNDTAGEIVDGDTIITPISDKNSILLEGVQYEQYRDLVIHKTGDSTQNNDTSNAAILVRDKAGLTLEDSEITTEATYANGIVITGEDPLDASVNLDNVTIRTSSLNSKGILVNCSTLNGDKVKITTTGSNSTGIKAVNDSNVDMRDGTITVTGNNSYPIEVVDSELELYNYTINNNRSIPTIDIKGNSIVSIHGGSITNLSLDAQEGGIYIHNDLLEEE